MGVVCRSLLPPLLPLTKPVLQLALSLWHGGMCRPLSITRCGRTVLLPGVAAAKWFGATDRFANPGCGRRRAEAPPPVIILVNREHIVLGGFSAVVEPRGKPCVLQVED